MKQVALAMLLIIGLTVLACLILGWRSGPGYALGLLIGGAAAGLLGAVLAAEPMPGMAKRGRKKSPQLDSSEDDQRQQDRREDRAIFDVLGPAGVLVMGLGLAVYLLF
ncbi:MAG: hypothetical protein KJ063_15245 [Anaerolineae bacterium]|nr:hypothetical protein [Anaerolineae bacterium]